MFAAADVVKIPVEIAQDHEIKITISIKIDPRSAGGPSASPNSVVVVELVSAISCHIKILEAVVIVITDGNPHAVSGSLKTGLLRHVLKCSVRFLVVKSIPVFRTCLLWNRPLGSRIAQRSAIHQKNVETAVVVVIKHCHSRSHRFGQILLGCV